MSRFPLILAVFASVSGAAAVFLTLSPGPLYASGALDLMPAFSLLLDAAPVAAVAAFALGFAGIISGVLLKARRSAALAVVAALVGGAVWLAVDDFKSRAAANPLHDVTTNVDTPPAFLAIAPRRYEEGSAAARAAYPHPAWRETHDAIYQDLETLVLPLAVGEAASRAGEIAEDLGWSIEASSVGENAGRFEAVDRTGWFGFVDDIVITITLRGEDSSAVDVRSVSRIGIGDVGKNAERIRTFLSRLRESS